MKEGIKEIYKADAEYACVDAFVRHLKRSNVYDILDIAFCTGSYVDGWRIIKEYYVGEE